MDEPIRPIGMTLLDILPEDVEPVDHEQVTSIKDSIQRLGMLLHPLVVIEKEGKYYVKAGRKRLYALRELGAATVLCLVISVDVSADKVQEIGLHENLKRYNLPWWEQCQIELELHSLRQKQHGVGRRGVKEGWSLRDTAKEIGIGFGTLSEDLRLAEAVMSDPNLRKIEDKITAKKLIFQTAKRIEAETEAGIAPKIEFDVVYHGNSAEILKHFPDNTFDVCFTDPPWLDYKDPKLVKDDQTVLVFKELYRVMKADSFLYVIVSTPDFWIYQQQLPLFGWKVQQMPLIWHKKNVISHGLRAWEYTRDYEPILLAAKGSPVFTQRAQASAVYSSPAVHPSKLIHPNEKPVDVPIHFLEHSSYEGSMVIDPFGGSGVTAEACIRLDRKFVTIERDKKFCDGIEARLKNARESLVLGKDSTNRPEQAGDPSVLPEASK